MVQSVDGTMPNFFAKSARFLLGFSSTFPSISIKGKPSASETCPLMLRSPSIRAATHTDYAGAATRMTRKTRTSMRALAPRPREVAVARRSHVAIKKKKETHTNANDLRENS